MSNFNPRNRQLPPEHWQELAHDSVEDTGSQYLIIGGIVGGLFAASVTAFPPTGLLVAGWGFYEAWRKTAAANRNERAIAEYGCVAHVLKGDSLRQFANQVGKDEALQQLNWAQENEYVLTPDAEEFLETNQEVIEWHKKPSEPEAITVNSSVVAIAPHQALPFQAAPDTRSWQPPQFDLIEEMGRRIANTLIVGIPGAGKGIVASNAVRSVKQHHPNKTIMWVDPKDDPQESGYFAVDGLLARRADSTQMNAIEVAGWLRECVEEFEALPGEKLLILDELVMIASKLKGQKKDIEWLKGYLIGLIAAGDSRGKNAWLIAQNSHLEDLGIGGGIASQLTPIALISDKNIAALEALLRTSFIPKCASADDTILRDLMNKSEVNRCYYHGGKNAWFPMPRLTNYSGIDRDTRTQINNYQPVPDDSIDTVRDSLERQFNSEPSLNRDEPLNHPSEPLNQPTDNRFGELGNGSVQRFTPLNLTREQVLGMISTLNRHMNQTEVIEHLWQVTKGGTRGWNEARSQFKELTGE